MKQEQEWWVIGHFALLDCCILRIWLVSRTLVQDSCWIMWYQLLCLECPRIWNRLPKRLNLPTHYCQLNHYLTSTCCYQPIIRASDSDLVNVSVISDLKKPSVNEPNIELPNNTPWNVKTKLKFINRNSLINNSVWKYEHQKHKIDFIVQMKSIWPTAQWK